MLAVIISDPIMDLFGDEYLLVLYFQKGRYAELDGSVSISPFQFGTIM